MMLPPCVFCRDGVDKAGKLLTCLHNICMECLAASVQRDGRIRCAKCRRPTTCPPPGRSHEEQLVDDSMFDNGPCDLVDKVHPLRNCEEMHLDTIPPDPTSSIQSRQKTIPRQGRVHHCPVHSKMTMRYYCAKCREVLCEKCKLQSKNASHTNQIGDISAEAAVVRKRLTERQRKISPEDKEEEVEAGMKRAGDLILKAFGCDLQGKVADIKRLIHEHCDEQLHWIKQRKEELMNEAELQSKKLRELQAHTFAEFNGVFFQPNALKAISKSPLRNEDLLKIHPHSTEVLRSSLQYFGDKNYSLMRRLAFEGQNPSGLAGIIGSTGEVVDKTDIDLSRCAFSEQNNVYIGYVGEETKITALVNNWQGNPISEPALKVCSIQIWATKIQATMIPVPVPISGYSKGEVRAHVQCTEAAVFLLEMRLESPRPLPKLQGYELIDDLRTCSPLNAKLLVYGCRSITFGDIHSSPKGFIRPCLSYSIEHIAYTHVTRCQIEDGFCSIRALEPIQDRYFAIAIDIVHGTSSKLDIGFTWDCGQSDQNMKMILASSAKKSSSSTPISGCCTGETIQSCITLS